MNKRKRDELIIIAKEELEKNNEKVSVRNVEKKFNELVRRYKLEGLKVSRETVRNILKSGFQEEKDKSTFLLIQKFILIGSLVLIIYGVSLYYTGSHNLDLGYNIRFINQEHGLSLQDINNKFEIVDAITLYIDGGNQMEIALYICMVGVFIFSSTLSIIIRKK